MTVLIVFGSKRGGTAGLAHMIAEALGEFNVPAVVRSAHRDARRFVRRHEDDLRRLPVWLVSSGPLDDSATAKQIPPTSQVAKLAARIGARGHVTFGGRLAPDAEGFPASAMAKNNAGDWRDPAHMRRWVVTLVDELRSMETA